ncbi:hypothetical protein NST28_09235 [Paenibacillus sp. FSL R10-2791]
MASLTLTHGITEAALIKDGVEGQPPIQIANAYKLNFTNQVKTGYQSVRYDPNRGAQLYDSSLGYGFVQETNALPAREVHTDSITSDGTGFFITESYFFAEPKSEKDNYNNYGMAFRMDASPGTYNVYVKTTSDAEDGIVSVSGMQTSRLLKSGLIRM